MPRLEMNLTTIESLWQGFKAQCQWPDSDIAVEKARTIFFCGCGLMFTQMVDYFPSPDDCPEAAVKVRGWLAEFERFGREAYEGPSNARV
jgi:hypothetical protein